MELLPPRTPPLEISVDPQNKVAYVIKDVSFGNFEVYKSANAWWMDSTKVTDLIRAFKSAYPIKMALIYIGISQRQWEYFNKLHPEFCRLKECCESIADTPVVQNAYSAAKNNPYLAMKWLDKRGFFKR